jgi:hypothetical protein
MQLADLAFGQGDDADAGKAQPLEQRGDVLLVARQPVQRLGHDDVERGLPGTFEQRPIARA